jgi:hypothetical protein
MEKPRYTLYPLFLLLLKRPAEIVDEEEDGEKTSKDANQKEDFSAMNGETEDRGGSKAAGTSEQEEGIPDHGEKKASPSRVNGGTDEENGEELDQVAEELQSTEDEKGKAEGDNSGQDEVLLLFLACLCINECAHAHTHTHTNVLKTVANHI